MEDRDRIWTLIKNKGGDLKLHEIMLQIQTVLSKKYHQIEGLNAQLQKLDEIKKAL